LQINYVLSSHGITVDARHVGLLAEVMTYKGLIYNIIKLFFNKKYKFVGLILGATRFGVSKL